MTFSLPHELLMRKEYERGLAEGKEQTKQKICEEIKERYPQFYWIAAEIEHYELG